MCAPNPSLLHRQTGTHARTYILMRMCHVPTLAQIGAVVGENTALTLTCESGVMTGIDFASFGTPNGTCGAFSKGACDANSTLSIVQKLCVGKSTCTIQASDTIFGGGLMVLFRLHCSDRQTHGHRHRHRHRHRHTCKCAVAFFPRQTHAMERPKRSPYRRLAAAGLHTLWSTLART